MMDGRSTRCCVEGSLFDLAVEQLASELRIVFRFHHLVVLSNRSLQILRRHSQLLGKAFERIVLIDASKLDKRLDVLGKRVVLLHNARIIDVVADRAGLLLDRSNKLISAGVFLDKTLAVLIDIDHIIKSGHLAGTSLQSTGSRSCKRVNLHIVHASDIRTDLGCHHNAVAGCSGLIGRNHVRRQHGRGLLAHFLVLAVAARGQNNAVLAVERVVVANLVGGLHADDFAVAVDELLRAHARDDLHAILVGSF